MNILRDISLALAPLGVPVEVGIYAGSADQYVVVTPLGERNDDIADDEELTETQEADINLYIQGNYQTFKNTAKTLLRNTGFFIKDSHYVTYETETKQHHYVLTVGKKEVI